MIPKIKFVYSDIYDRIWGLRANGQSKEKIIKYIVEVGKLWKKEENKVLNEISKIMELNWKEKEIKCYIITKGRCFSDPLTLRVFKSKKDFIDTLTHEMIHQLQSQNINEFIKWKRNFLDKKYKKESLLTKNHILLHAVHKKIFLNSYNKNRLERQIKSHSVFSDYSRAWEIVNDKENNIINKFLEVKNE